MAIGGLIFITHQSSRTMRGHESLSEADSKVEAARSVDLYAQEFVLTLVEEATWT